jgi:hypothetical protein
VGTRFDYVDLSVVRDLENVEHGAGPITINIDMIYKPGGKIRAVLLRGCGVPQEFIAHIGSMVGRPIEYHSCFISYSTKCSRLRGESRLSQNRRFCGGGVEDWRNPS